MRFLSMGRGCDVRLCAHGRVNSEGKSCVVDEAEKTYACALFA